MSRSQIPPGLLLRVIQNKREIIAYYNALARLINDRQASVTLSDIREDETAHLNMFSTLYIDLFGEIPADFETEDPAISTAAEGLRSAVMLELEAYEHYGTIILSDSNEHVRDTFTRALFDENRHAVLFTFLITQSLSA